MSSDGKDAPDGVAKNPSDSESEKGATPQAMNLSSDEVNYLIFRYLQESGYVHSAFSFAHETMLGRTGLRSADKTLPPGALISFLQKGLQYVGMEEKLRLESSGSPKASHPGYSLLAPPTVAALKRKHPPIKLNVPPATAAAALKAKLEKEAEARLLAERRSSVVPSQMTVPGALATAAASPIGRSHPHAVVHPADPNSVNFARQTLATQAAAAHAAAGLSQLQPQAIQDPFQQQRAAVELAVLQQQQQALLGHPSTSAAGDALANANAAQGSKRTGSSSKRSSKKQKKEKLLQQQQQQQQEQASEAKPMEVDPPSTSRQERRSPPAPEGSSISAQQQQQQNHEATPNGHSSDQNGDTAPKSPIPTTSDGPLTNGVQRTPNKKPDNKSLASTNDTPDDSATAVREEEILRLDMHQSEVFMCAWNPVNTELIATGSGDASARIWQMHGLHAADGVTTVKLLPHGVDPKDRKNKDVTTLDWSSDGKCLATGSYDGVARVWGQNGSLLHTLQGHAGPIFSLKWNKAGNFLLSGSYDKTTIVWNVSGASGVIEQQFTDHEAAALDVDWKDNETFASCSTDKTVHVCKVGCGRPLKVFVGHTDEVNAVKWSPCKKMLASCSDDCTAKVWDVESDRTTPLFDLTAHKQEIYTAKWSPTGPGSPNPHKKALLATASFDGTVRLWDVGDGSCFRVFDRHRDSVYSVAFAPSGDFMASGSLAGQMYIWNIQKGSQIKSYKGKGDIFEVAWNKEETRVAACFSSNSVAVIDFVNPAENNAAATTTTST